MLSPMAQPGQPATPADPRADMYDLYLSNTKDSIIKQLAQAGAPADPKARKADLVAQLYDAKSAPQVIQAPPMAPPPMPPLAPVSGVPVPGMPPDPGADQGQSLLAQALMARRSVPDQSAPPPDQEINPLQMRLRNAIAGVR